MDPESNIREQLEIAEQINAICDGVEDDEEGRLTREEAEDLAGHAIRLAELVEALNAWLMRGGFLPTAWGTRCVDTSAHTRARP